MTNPPNTMIFSICSVSITSKPTLALFKAEAETVEVAVAALAVAKLAAEDFDALAFITSGGGVIYSETYLLSTKEWALTDSSHGLKYDSRVLALLGQPA